MADHSDYPGGAYLNTETGEVVPSFATDASTVGEEYAVDVDTDDWVHLVDESHEGWQDMADFAVAVEDLRTQGRVFPLPSCCGAGRSES